MYRLKIFIAFLLLSFAPLVYGQGSGGGAGGNGVGTYELGFKLGVGLPAGIAQLSNVNKTIILNGALPIEEGHIVFQSEIGFGVSQHMIKVLGNYRMPAFEGEFSPYFMLGPYFVWARGSSSLTNNQVSSVFTVGFDLGGGFYWQLKPNTIFDFQLRVDMNPGTMVVLAIGLNFIF